MKYVSTRGSAPALGFEDALLTGVAHDGGLYVPETWPGLSPTTIAGFAGASYQAAAFEVMRPFIGGAFDDAVFADMIDRAYAGFDHPEVAPVRPLDPDEYLVELFHGPTLAFKDVAMQLLGRMMEHVLEHRASRVTIVGATSGDTGAAAIEAFKGREACDVFILHPHGRVSEVQRRQMTTVTEANVHNIAIEGTFDDCQALVKAMFGHHSFRDRLRLAGVNSVNWARVMAQTVYYFTAVAAIAARGDERAVDFSVPTGNFGDIFAGYVAAQMGCNINRLKVATNVNDILVRALETGRYQPREVVATASPSMDIQVSSNFERLLFDVHDRDGASIDDLMRHFAETRAFEIAPTVLGRIRDLFDAARADENETASAIATVYRDHNVLIDPHTAVGVHAARAGRRDDTPVAILSTAHPAKFPDAVEAAARVRPALPERMSDLMAREERCEVLANDLAAVESFIDDQVMAA